MKQMKLSQPTIRKKGTHIYVCFRQGTAAKNVKKRRGKRIKKSVKSSNLCRFITFIHVPDICPLSLIFYKNCSLYLRSVQMISIIPLFFLKP